MAGTAASESELFRLTARAAIDLVKRRQIHAPGSGRGRLGAHRRHGRCDPCHAHPLPRAGPGRGIARRSREPARGPAHRRQGSGGCGRGAHHLWLAHLCRSCAGDAPTSWWSGSRRRGAIVIGKSNTPEFGAGANSYNQLFEATRTPWRTDLTSGGSSGGSAAALAAGQAWLATGSDLGGSLRTPASFCGVVGLRPSPGRVASGPCGLSLRHPLRQRPHGAQRRRCGADAGCHGGTGG